MDATRREPAGAAVFAMMLTILGWGLGWVAAMARGTDEAWLHPTGLWMAAGMLFASGVLGTVGIVRIATSEGRKSGLGLAISALVLDLLGGGFVAMGLLRLVVRP